MNINDESLKAALEAVAKAGRLLTISGCTIDLDKVLYLDWTKASEAFWVVMQGTSWDSDGDYYHNAPYITGADNCDAFIRAWDTYLVKGGVQGPAHAVSINLANLHEMNP